MQSNTTDGFPARWLLRFHSCVSEQRKNAPLSVSCLPVDTITGTYHPEGLPPSTSSPCIARCIASSLPSGGGGTFASHAMFTKTLRPFGMGVGPGAGSSKFPLGLVGGGGGGGSTAGASVEDLMQNPALGESSMRTRVEDDIQESCSQLRTLLVSAIISVIGT